MIVAVSGGKGGVGKTTVSLNLGRELDAVVVDADLTAPDLPRGRGPDLHDVLAGRADPMEAVEAIGSVPILPCGRTLAGARAADIENLGEALELLDRRFDFVVVDAPAGIARDVGYQLSCADAAVLVTMPKRPALLNALRTRRLAQEVETPVLSVVLNKTSRDDDEDIAERVRDEFGTPTTTVAKDPEILETQEMGKPIRDVYPESPALEAFRNVATTVEECQEQMSDRVGVL